MYPITEYIQLCDIFALCIVGAKRTTIAMQVAVKCCKLQLARESSDGEVRVTDALPCVAN